ncbi:chondroitin sulfate synthase 1 isoform X2 [Aethina tumida]|uniref:chondroitin sulfate synthase 1 isoform X2 n=1 Tax=Aethina tumida TaxID=116153 RepID=UPI00096AF856|nr:chondroitin sulfate synthase 1 isoform X2 [Aethina tumida]
MARRKKLMKLILGLLMGFIFTQMFTISNMAMQDMCMSGSRMSPMDLINVENARAQNKNLLFVGIMTASRYLDTRAKAVYNTWGREVPGKVMFFSSEYSISEHVPLVPLPGVDDTYPPQKKSFMMLKHMYDNYIDKYEWFLRADDDVYIRTDRLEDLLRSVDSSKPWFIGQTGRGNHEEFGLLSLDSDENFCMGGTGVIFSRETLKRMAPYVEQCLRQLYTTHEDVELGRCVRRFAGISCTWSYEMQTIFYNNRSGPDAFTGDLKQKEVHRAITLHPVKHPKHMHRLHKYVKGLKIQANLQKSIELHRDIAVSMRELGYQKDRLDTAILVRDLPLYPAKRGSDNYLGDTKILGTPITINRYTPHDLQNVLEWELISKALYSHRDLSPKKRIGSSMKEGLNDVTREIMDIVNSYSKQRGRVIEFKEILYGYWRLDPTHGVDLILDLLLVYKKYRGHKMTVQVRRHAYVQQTFSEIAIREVLPDPVAEYEDPNSVPVHKKLVQDLFSKISKNLPPIFNFMNETNKSVINFVMPLKGRYATFRRFITMYSDVVLKEKELAKLHIILYEDPEIPSDYIRSKYLIEKIRRQFTYRSINLIMPEESFSRGKALQHGVDALEKDDLMVFIDVDMIFDKSYLDRVRWNTVKNKSVYYPIVYSLYDPGLLNKSYTNAEFSLFKRDMIDDVNGYWRFFGFGIVSLYKSDYLNLGGFNLHLNGWGYEDVNFFDNTIKSNLRIVRAVDPALIHVFHAKNCKDAVDSDQKLMCLGTKANSLGSTKTLQHVFMKYRKYFR